MATSTTERPGARAQLRYLRVSASKVRVVLDLIRGLPVGQASQVLQLSERGVSRDVSKVLDSAVANAIHNEDIPGEELMVSACWADEGPTLKRFRPRARGRAGRINKRTSHITIVVSRLTDEELDAARSRAESKGTTTTDAAAARRRRVAASRADEVTEAEESEETVVADTAEEAAAASTEEAAATSADEAEATPTAEVEEAAEATEADTDAPEADTADEAEAEADTAAEASDAEAEAEDGTEADSADTDEETK